MACKQVLPIQEKGWRLFRLCPGCKSLIEKIRPPVCPRCGSPIDEDTPERPQSFSENAFGAEEAPPSCPSCYGKSFFFGQNISAFPYGGIIRDILHDIKFRSRKQAALGLGELWASCIDSIPPADLIVPVPMHPRKIRSRGFNQAEVMSRAISKKFNITLEKKLLKRTADTPPQSGLSPRLREENVRGVFALNEKISIRNKKIILTDDIFTTGVSLNECASVLINGGAETVFCLTAAIAVGKSGKTN
jgi:ComF family protein